MSRASIIATVGYGAWVVVCFLITVLNIGDGGVNAHLALIFTGPPASLLSLYLPHGTLTAVLAAGVLGLIQWSAIAELVSRWSSGRSADRGA